MKYIPLLKTTSAELKGYAQLPDEIKREITPLFELTRDRTHKELYPEGRLEQALAKALDAQPIGQLLLDLTTHESLMNSQIEALFSEANGYENWTRFIRDTGCAERIIPVIQLDADAFDIDENAATLNVQRQIGALAAMSPRVAIRANLDIEPQELLDFVRIVLGAGLEPNRLIIIIDAEFIKPYTSATYADDIVERIELIVGACRAKIFAVCASSFPKSVVETNYGADDQGTFPIEEVNLNREIDGKLPDGVDLIYSDYGSVHPIRYEVKGGSWVPRVDLPLENEIYYYRRRRNAGGYKAAATLVRADVRYRSVDTWGNDQIEAATKVPQGASPSHWISVRINIHVCTQLKRVEALQNV
ncbi:beta family protein [Brucella intermedia]|uniref:beta family protein n=1 Tax=Brucella intermedia TaxID=94625 RepID=UPI001591C4A2|nr:beta family protein [Brucella intermedia]